MNALIAERRIDEASAVFDEMMALEKDAKEIPPEITSRMLVAGAVTAAARRDGHAALALSERALSTIQNGESHPYELATARLLLARSLSHEHVETQRAISLCPAIAGRHSLSFMTARGWTRRRRYSPRCG